MSKEVQNSIEELVNSSLDIAAEEVMEDADTTVDSELEAIEDNGLTEPEELDLNTVKDIEDIEVQIEPDSELEDKIDSVPVESIEALENEVSELETEIQTQMDSLVVKADHLKNSIQSEIQRVSDKNEELQIQVTQLEKQLLESEGKVEALVEVQDRQQETIKKLIRILKGVNTKITHLYDSKD
jgi:DNA repair exonuclease SbcCD ATPase subunit